MKLLFALGNPGSDYQHTRHNTGFVVIDAFAHAHDASFRAQTKFAAGIAELSIDGEKVILAKPHTFYNEVGRSYQAICAFYKLTPEDTIIVHDELALPLGTLRSRQGGSPAGNNGIKSIITHGGEQSYRLRIGIWTELQQQVNDADFVLSRFTKGEIQTLSQITPLALEQLETFVATGHTATTISI